MRDPVIADYSYISEELPSLATFQMLSIYCQNSDGDGSCPKFLWVYYHMGFMHLFKSVAVFFLPKL